MKSEPTKSTLKIHFFHLSFRNYFPSDRCYTTNSSHTTTNKTFDTTSSFGRSS